MFEFEWPWMFVLVLLPLLIPLLSMKFPRESSEVKRRDIDISEEQALIIPFLNELDDAKDNSKDGVEISKPSVSPFLLQLLLFIAWVLLVAASAKPVWIDDVGNVPISSRNIMVAVDLSGSMARRDFRLQGSRITRLAATKKVAGNFIDHRVGDRIALILFADHAYLQAPLTRDRQTVIALLNEAELGLAGERTALGDAIGLAVKKVQQQTDEEHVLVLMTDGAATVGVNVDEAIRFAMKVKLKIYTVGIGSISTSSSDAKAGSKPGSDLDEITLKHVANKTGGRYFRAKSIADLESIYQQLDKLEPVIETSEAWYPVKDLFAWPLALSCLLLLAFGLLSGGIVSNTNHWFFRHFSMLKRNENG